LIEMLSEVIAIFVRWNKKLLRQPILIFFNLIQPLVWFLLFTQAFSAIGNIPTFQLLTGTSSYITFFTAAVIIQTIASSALNAGIGLVNDFDSGFMDKMRVAPINKSSILFGRLFSNALTTVIQVAIILVIGLVLGVNIASGVFGAMVIFILAALFGIASASVMPLGLLPSWVQQVAQVNPFTYIAEAFQSLIINGFVWQKIEYALIAIVIVGVLSLGSSILLFRRKIS
jgi:ABC-2 type transport system permease protein